MQEKVKKALQGKDPMTALASIDEGVADCLLDVVCSVSPLVSKLSNAINRYKFPKLASEYLSSKAAFEKPSETPLARLIIARLTPTLQTTEAGYLAEILLAIMSHNLQSLFQQFSNSEVFKKLPQLLKFPSVIDLLIAILESDSPQSLKTQIFKVVAGGLLGDKLQLLNITVLLYQLKQKVRAKSDAIGIYAGEIAFGSLKTLLNIDIKPEQILALIQLAQMLNLLNFKLDDKQAKEVASSVQTLLKSDKGGLPQSIKLSGWLCKLVGGQAAKQIAVSTVQAIQQYNLWTKACNYSHIQLIGMISRLGTSIPVQLLKAKLPKTMARTLGLVGQVDKPMQLQQRFFSKKCQYNLRQKLKSVDQKGEPTLE